MRKKRGQNLVNVRIVEKHRDSRNWLNHWVRSPSAFHELQIPWPRAVPTDTEKSPKFLGSFPKSSRSLRSLKIPVVKPSKLWKIQFHRWVLSLLSSYDIFFRKGKKNVRVSVGARLNQVETKTFQSSRASRSEVVASWHVWAVERAYMQKQIYVRVFASVYTKITLLDNSILKSTLSHNPKATINNKNWSVIIQFVELYLIDLFTNIY